MLGLLRLRIARALLASLLAGNAAARVLVRPSAPMSSHSAQICVSSAHGNLTRFTAQKA
jgi:hypothetical protein